jgi:tetratricopeptide (TPR) repeat protein
VSNQEARELQDRAIQAARAGNKDEARKLLSQSLRLEPSNDAGWVWMASVARDKRERVLCLKKALEINPHNETAQKAVRAMGIDPEQLAPPPPSIDDSLVAADEAVETAGVPLPDMAELVERQELAEEIAQAYLATIQPETESRVNWVRKTRGRAGEREIILLRLQVGAAIVTFLILVFGGAALAVSNSPEAQLVLFGASPTPRPPTSTPTNTPTQTPGFTPTPSPTRDFTNEPTFTPSPTILPTITPGRIELTPEPTQPQVVQPVEVAVSAADRLFNAGNYELPLPTLAAARAQQGDVFNPNPYYYEALGYTGLGNYNAALNLLADAEGRIERFEGVRGQDVTVFQPIIDLGFAEVHLQQARDALQAANRAAASEYLALARDRATAAQAGNNRLSRTYVILAESYLLESNYDEALNMLNRAEGIPEFAVDMNLIVTRGRIYLERGRTAERAGNLAAAHQDFHNAAYQAFYGVYIDPFNAAAHQLRVEAALELGDPGLGVIHSQAYLLFFPNSAQAFRMLGDSRVAEGNNDLARETYSSALGAQGTDDVIAQVLESRAALYADQRRYALALQDLTAAIELRDTLAARASRIRMAYAAGAYEIAQEDAEALLGTGIIPDNEIRLVQARILIDQAAPGASSTYSQALGLLNQIGNDLPAAEIPFADEYRARAHFALNNLGDALAAANRSLSAAQTGSRRHLRAQILEAQEDYDSAIADYEWVLRWNRVYDYDFAASAADRIAAIREVIAQAQATATATAITATAAVEQATATAEAEATATSAAATVAVEQATATAEAAATATAIEQVTATAEAESTATAAIEQATATAEAESTATAEALPTATPTPTPTATATEVEEDS